MKMYIVYRVDRMGEDAIELVFDNKEAADRFASVENLNDRHSPYKVLELTVEK